MSDFETPWTVAHQASLSIGFPRQEDRSGLPFPSQREIPSAGVELIDSLLLSYQERPN